ncbi:MAG: SCP2 sterol-binding domain-containing protein [Rhodospirillales bacterium]|nr:SCP2 sterol-binding domain-containing protein [Rhodospirillales bacterium]
MSISASSPSRPCASRLRTLPRIALAPIPLFLLQPLLRFIVTGVARRHPALFNRLGSSQNKAILIDPTNLPFALLLHPRPDTPTLEAVRRKKKVPHDAKITGTFLTLLDMIDGNMDGDALFFTRDLKIEGDTEAIVALRNALDDMDISLADDLAAHAGPLSGALKKSLRALQGIRRSHQ